VRRIPVGLPPMQNHVAFRVDLAKEEIFERLTLRGIAARYEPRGPGLVIAGFDDPDGNFVELFPNIETIELPPQAFCDAQELDRVMAECRALLDRWASVDERGQPVYPLGVGIFRKSFRKGFVVTVAPVSPPAKGLSDRPETVATITNLVAKSFDEVLGGFGVALTHVKAVGVGSPSVAM
jgi:hypothetical protein